MPKYVKSHRQAGLLAFINAINHREYGERMEARLILTKHASEKLLERGMSANLIRKIAEKGVRIEDKESGAMLRIYKEKTGKFYTLVTDEGKGQITVITCYESSAWQAEFCKKVKKNERSKMR